MHYLLDDKELEKIQEVSDITMTDYEITGKFIPVENMMSAIEELLVELHRREEKIEDLEREEEKYYE